MPGETCQAKRAGRSVPGEVCWAKCDPGERDLFPKLEPARATAAGGRSAGGGRVSTLDIRHSATNFYFEGFGLKMGNGYGESKVILDLALHCGLHLGWHPWRFVLAVSTVAFTKPCCISSGYCCTSPSNVVLQQVPDLPMEYNKINPEH